MRDIGDTEVGGFGICPNELLLVEDIQLVDQKCTCTTVKFDDDAVANYFDEQVDAGLHPEQFARVWIHTHPGECPHPSLTDEETFFRVFGKSDWAVMFILACGGSTYCRLKYETGPGCELEVPVDIDFDESFEGTDHDGWNHEYFEKVSCVDTYEATVGSLVDRDWIDEQDEFGFYAHTYRPTIQEQEEEIEYLY